LIITLIWVALVRRGINARMMPPEALRYDNDNVPDHVKLKRRWF
jgi:hypothetical protein